MLMASGESTGEHAPTATAETVTLEAAVSAPSVAVTVVVPAAAVGLTITTKVCTAALAVKATVVGAVEKSAAFVP